MSRKKGSFHVAKISRKHKNGKTYHSYLLRRSYRQGNKVKHQTLGNISNLPLEIIEMIRATLKGERFIQASKAFEVVRSRPHGHVAAVLGMTRCIGLDSLIASRPCKERSCVLAMTLARILSPGSKLATARELNSETASCTLGEELGLEAVYDNELYRAMDWLQKRQRRIENKLAKKHLGEGSLILYDVTSSYYTGACCALAQYGHDRDKNGSCPIIVYGLLCSAEGCPIAVEVFSGNTADPKTLSAQIEKIRRRFAIKRVVLVGDRGMLTSRRIEQECRHVEGLDWITALRAPAVAALVQQKVIQPGLFDQTDLARIDSPDYPGERLIVCRNPFLAEERKRKREDLLAATEKLLEPIVKATRRPKRPLKGKDKIGLRVGKVINRYKMAKHFELRITEESFSFERIHHKIASEAALDGLYVIRTSVKKERLSDVSTVQAYKDLSKVERAFRCLKTVDLKVRPIYHRNSDRVRAHIFICMLAYYLEWHLRQRWAPLLFEDHDKAAGQAQRCSVVAAAQSSQKAKVKAQSKRTEEGFAAHSFATLLKDLGTIARNRLRPLDSGLGDHEFSMETKMTASQRHAFELLKLNPSA